MIYLRRKSNRSTRRWAWPRPRRMITGNPENYGSICRRRGAGHPIPRVRSTGFDARRRPPNSSVKILSLPQRKNEKPCRLKTDLFNVGAYLRKDYIGHGWAPPESGGEAETALADAISRFFVDRYRGRRRAGIFLRKRGRERKNKVYIQCIQCIHNHKRRQQK